MVATDFALSSLSRCLVREKNRKNETARKKQDRKKVQEKSPKKLDDFFRNEKIFWVKIFEREFFSVLKEIWKKSIDLRGNEWILFPE